MTEVFKYITWVPGPGQGPPQFSECWLTEKGLIIILPSVAFYACEGSAMFPSPSPPGIAAPGLFSGTSKKKKKDVSFPDVLISLLDLFYLCIRIN